MARNRLRSFLVAQHPHLAVVSEASDGLEAMARSRSFSADVLLLELEIPKLDGPLVTCMLHSKDPQIKVIVWSSGDPAGDAWKALRAGACGYISKQAALPELAQALAKVAAGEAYFKSDIVGVVFKRLLNHWAEAQRYESLTLREREVLVSIAQGLGTADIAGRLDLANRTILAHREKLHAKLSLRGVAALTRFAVAQGLIDF